MLKENFVFFREFVREFQTTGAAFPTSRWAAEALTDPLRQFPRTSKKILELGPGTGSVTVQILQEMVPGDSLTVCEINPRFLQAVKDRLADNTHYQNHRDQISFFEGPVQEMPEDVQYDVIVCAIPFLNFDVETVHEIFEKLRRLSHSETLMTYFEYIGLRKVGKAMAPPGPRKQRMQEVDGYMETLAERIRLRRERVWLNLLPINIYTVRPAAA